MKTASQATIGKSFLKLDSTFDLAHPYSCETFIVTCTSKMCELSLLRCFVKPITRHSLVIMLVFAWALSVVGILEGASPLDESTTLPDGAAMAHITSNDFNWTPFVEAPRVAARAWEARPYQVAVWICHQGLPELIAYEGEVFEDIEAACELKDASSWFVNVGTPAGPTRNFLFSTVQDSEPGGEFENDPMLKFYDKLMVVRLERVAGRLAIIVRDYDLQTGQWGPIVEKVSTNMGSLGAVVADGIAQAFMPLARIDRIDVNNKVHIKPRASETCVRVDWKNEMSPEIVPVTTSPVYVRQTDRFLPIIRKTDRSGKLISLDPIEFTFLTIDKVEETELIASIHSSHRTPLSQRKSKRSQKLAVVIRPVERPSTLHLKSSDKEDPQPLEGYEVWARRPGDTKDVKSTFLGKTDWRGNIQIPPAPEGLRLIYIKRGKRALKRLPVIPGFKDRLVSTLPNDDARLFSEGVIRGYNYELLNLVLHRNLLEGDIESLIGGEKFQEADGKLQEYKALETPTDMKRRMSNEEVRLKSMTEDQREMGYITEMFQNLKGLLDSQVANSRDIELQNRTLGVSTE